MSAAYVSNLVINAGTDFDQVFTLENTSTNDTLNLTSYTVSSQMRKHAGSSNFVSFASTVVNGSLGQIRIGLSTTITSTLRPGRYVYDVIIKDSFGKKSRAIEGMVLVREGVTK
jgi:hypothetical protein